MSDKTKKSYGKQTYYKSCLFSKWFCLSGRYLLVLVVSRNVARRWLCFASLHEPLDSARNNNTGKGSDLIQYVVVEHLCWNL